MILENIISLCEKLWKSRIIISIEGGQGDAERMADGFGRD